MEYTWYILTDIKFRMRGGIYMFKKNLIILLCVFILSSFVLPSCTGQGTTGNQSSKNETTKPNDSDINPPAQDGSKSPTTGLSVTGNPYYGVMIENYVDARPQTGLDKADIVYEALAEGGITRFIAIFHDNIPTVAGPVRSARPYFVSIV